MEAEAIKHRFQCKPASPPVNRHHHHQQQPIHAWSVSDWQKISQYHSIRSFVRPANCMTSFLSLLSDSAELWRRRVVSYSAHHHALNPPLLTATSLLVCSQDLSRGAHLVLFRCSPAAPSGPLQDLPLATAGAAVPWTQYWSRLFFLPRVGSEEARQWSCLSRFSIISTNGPYDHAVFTKRQFKDSSFGVKMFAEIRMVSHRWLQYFFPNQICQKQCKIEPSLLLNVNTKLCVIYRMVSFQWPWMTPNIGFKVTVLFKGEYLKRVQH